MINRNPRVLNALAVLAVFLVVVLSLGLAQFVDQLAAVDVRLAGGDACCSMYCRMMSSGAPPQDAAK